MKKMRDDVNKLNPSILIKKLVEETEILDNVGTQALDYVYDFIEKIRGEEKKGEVYTLEDGLNFIEENLKPVNHYNGSSSNNALFERSVMLSDENNSVHIANVHKVKGLQNKIVILSFHEKNHINKYRELISYSLDETKGTFILEGEENEIVKIERVKEEENAEHLRINYVAATRAENALIIASNSDDADKCAWSPLLYKNSEEQEKFDFLKNISEIPLNKVDKEITKAKEIPQKKLFDESRKDYVFSNESSRNVEKRSYKVILPSLDKNLNTQISKDNEQLKDLQSNLSEKSNDKFWWKPNLFGTMVHRLMQMLVLSGGKIDLSNSIKQILSENEKQMDKKDIDNISLYSKALENVGKKMLSGGYIQKSGKSEDILSELKKATQIKCEVPFCYKNEIKDSEYELIHGVMDLVYEKDNNWYIVDYKTDIKFGKHEDQLKHYEKAFEKLTGKKADSRIYHINCAEDLKKLK